MCQEYNINHHWDLTPVREPIVCNLYVKNQLSRAVRIKARAQRESKVCKIVSVRQGSLLLSRPEARVKQRVLQFTKF